MFTVYPAIDLRNGRVVRLKQGRAENEIVYADDPAAVAQQWARAGATWLHIVNLDGAFGQSDESNGAALEKILDAVTIPVQFGGGLRDLDAMRRAFAMGVRRIILGTLALEQPRRVAEAVREFGAEKIALAIDARKGMAAARGWTNDSSIAARDLGKQMRALGVTRAVVTDIARDGMLSGIDAQAMAEFARATNLRVIASGGVASVDDVRQLARIAPGEVEGVVVGQALYSGAVKWEELVAGISKQYSASGNR